MDNPQDVYDLLVKHGLAHRADELMAYLRPSIRLSVEPADDADIPVGASKIGGNPDLPADFVWPIWEDEEWSEQHIKNWLHRFKYPSAPEKVRPLAFLAQFNLAEIAHFDAAHQLPSNGMLYFFCDPFSVYISGTTDDGRAHVYSYAGTQVRRGPTPTNLHLASRYPSTRLTFQTELTLPSLECEFFYGSSAYSSDELDSTMAVEIALIGDIHSDDIVFHRLLGYPQPVQNCVETEYELGVLSRQNPAQSNDELYTKACKNSERWRLLLQLDSERDLFSWEDSGRMYFCLTQEAFAAHRFGEAVAIIQCH
jgi:uncharacterized protein YwqG